LGRNPGAAARQLALSGIGFVLIDKSQVTAEVLAALDATAGLGRITDTDQAVLWRVTPDGLTMEGLPVDRVAQLFLVGPGQAVGLPASGKLTATLTEETAAQAHGHFQAGEMTLLLAERRHPGWRATLNGYGLTPAEYDGWQQAFVVPAGASGQLRIWHQSAFPWVPVQLAALALTALLALPLRRHSGEEAEVE